MKTLMMSLVFVIATGCATVGSTTEVANKEEGEAAKAKKTEEGLRGERQQALLEALEGKKAQ